jgi:hypothetical protein
MLGNLFKQDPAQQLIVKPILTHLFQLISKSEIFDKKAKSNYLKNNQFNESILVTSNLREAPALGAGIDAWNNYVKI